ncbi:hypothetical protein BGW80DRAFT_1324060, partial [Lactifluus volemus]
RAQMVTAQSPFCTQKGGVIDQADSGRCGSPSCSSLIDGALVALGNILFLGDLRVSLITGPQKTNKLRGTACFLGGILFVFLKWPAIDVLMEIFGFLNLFGFGASRFTCHRCMASTLAYAISHFPARLYDNVILGSFVIGYPHADHRLWPGAAPRF